MDIVNAVPVPDAGKEGAFFFYLQRIPADVGNLQPGGNCLRNRANFAADQAQTLVLAVFVALIEKKLHTEADAEEGGSLPCQFTYRTSKPALTEFCGSILKGSHTG